MNTFYIEIIPKNEVKLQLQTGFLEQHLVKILLI